MIMSRVMTGTYTDSTGQVKKRKIRKFFSSSDQCSFCSKKGHQIGFCPCLPTEPLIKIPFVESLLKTPQIKMKYYEGLTKMEIVKKISNDGKDLNIGNPWVDDPRPFSSLRKHLGFWKVLGADRSVLSWIAYGYRMRFQSPPQRTFFRNAQNTMDYEAFIDKEIETHLSDGSFVEIRPEEAWVVNPFLISVNSSGKPRRCDDMRYINGFLASPEFKMQTLDRDIPNLVRTNDVMFNKDLEKAYYKVPVADDSLKYQCFYWKGRFYKSLVLLFGFCQAPFIFTKICRVIVRFCGALMIRVMNFIDDFLFTDDKRVVEDLRIFMEFIFTILGWTLSTKDNQIGERIKFLGYVVDSVQRRFHIPDSVCAKTTKIIDMICESHRENRTIRLSDVQKLTGKLISLRLAIPSVSVWIRDVYFCYPEEEQTEDPVVSLTTEAVQNLMTVKRLITLNPSSPFISPLEDRDIYIDSGECGWGAQLLGTEVWGTFDASVIGKSSTYRELKGVILALENPLLSNLLSGKAVRFNLDSKCAIANLVHSGPVRDLSPLTQTIWRTFDQMQITPLFRWVPRETEELSRVDTLSKLVTFGLKPQSEKRLKAQLRCEILSINHNEIGNAIASIVVKRMKCGLLVPRWEGKSWWQVMKQYVVCLYPVPSLDIKFSQKVNPGWEFLIALFDFHR